MSQIFSSFYPNHCPLIDYLSDIRHVVCKPTDQQAYTDLLKNTIVCYHGNKPKNISLSFIRGFRIRELIKWIIATTCNSSNSSNVLSLGYAPPRDKDRYHFNSYVNEHPNSNVTLLLLQQSWHTLYDRVGDDLMVHLLKDVSMFLLVGESCYIQFSGTPMYNLPQAKVVNVNASSNGSKERQPRNSVSNQSKSTRKKHQRDSFAKKLKKNQGVSKSVTSKSSDLTVISDPKSTDNLVQDDPKSNDLTVQSDPKSSVVTPSNNSACKGHLLMEDEIHTEVTSKYDTVNPPGHDKSKPVTATIYPQISISVDNTQEQSATINVEEFTRMRKRKRKVSKELPSKKQKTRENHHEELRHVEKQASQNGKVATQPHQNVAKQKRKRKRKASKNSTSKKQRCNKDDASKSDSTSLHVDGSPSDFVSKISTLYFPRPAIMYSSNLRDKFPKNHITSTTSASKTGVTRLIKVIFTNNKKQKGQKLPKKRKIHRLSKRFLKMRPLFEQVLRRHKKCQFNKLLNRHCKETFSVNSCRKGAPESSKSEDNSKDQADVGPDKATLEYQNAVKHFTPTYKVFQFVKSVCKEVIPANVWGTEDNEHRFYKNLKRFLALRKGEMFSLGQMVDRIKPSSCGWLKLTSGKRIPLSESEKQKEVLYRWIWWLVNDYIMVILKSFFYITEGASQSKVLYYYRKPVWRVIQAFGIKVVTSEMLSPITKSEAADLVKSNATLGISTMRFLPKPSTVRPIVNMGSKPRSDKKGLNLSINSKLRNLFEVIKFENKRKPTGARHVLFGVDDVYNTLKSFNAKRNGQQGEQPLYFVHVDIHKCFDTIILQRLYLIMKDLFTEEEYVIRRFVVFKGSHDQVTKKFEKDVTLADDCRTFQQFTSDIVKEKGLQNMVFVDQVCHVHLKRKEVYNILKHHLLMNVVKVVHELYKQVKGIAQGSILSSYLCSQFYTHMERRYLNTFTQDDTSLLLRWVDDFLFMTPDQSKADRFLSIMNAGIDKYGCQISATKTLVNYATSTGIPVRQIDRDEWFPWCGFLIDPKSLDVKVDYSRYQDVKIKDSFTRSLHSHPGRVLVKRLSLSARNKCHPLLVDLNMNSETTVLSNFYEMFYWLALKFYWWCRDFPKGRQVCDNPAFINKVVFSLPRLVCSAIKRKFQRLSCLQAGCMVDDSRVKLVFNQAFIACLKTKPLFKKIVKALRHGRLRFTNPAQPKLRFKNPFLVEKGTGKIKG